MGKRTIHERNNSYFQWNIGIRVYGQQPDKSNGTTNDGRFGRILICSIHLFCLVCARQSWELIKFTDGNLKHFFIYEIKRCNTITSMAQKIFMCNKTVLLRERKRHTARCVSSTSSVVLSQGGGGGTPSLVGWGG